jgi:quercetin dioxygenase-like cupin family protein
MILGGLFGAALGDFCQLPEAAAKNAAAPKSGSEAPWVRRVFHMFTSADGASQIRPVPVPKLGSATTVRLLRRPAERVTVGTMAPGFMMDYHIANQPNYLIPIFGTLVVQLKDGSTWTFKPGDILFAEDCTGGGHRSGAGPDGCFSVSVQIAKTEHCEATARDPANVLLGGDGPPA